MKKIAVRNRRSFSLHFVKYDIHQIKLRMKVKGLVTQTFLHKILPAIASFAEFLFECNAKTCRMVMHQYTLTRLSYEAFKNTP